MENYFVFTKGNNSKQIKDRFEATVITLLVETILLLVFSIYNPYHNFLYVWMRHLNWVEFSHVWYIVWWDNEFLNQTLQINFVYS